MTDVESYSGCVIGGSRVEDRGMACGMEVYFLKSDCFCDDLVYIRWVALEVAFRAVDPCFF